MGVNLLRNSMKVCKAALAGWVQGQEGLTRWDTILCLVFLPCLYTSAHILLNANAGQEGRLLRAHKSRIDFQWGILLSPLTMGAVFAKTDLSVDPAFIGSTPDRSSASRGMLARYLAATHPSN